MAAIADGRKVCTSPSALLALIHALEAEKYGLGLGLDQGLARLAQAAIAEAGREGGSGAAAALQATLAAFGFDGHSFCPLLDPSRLASRVKGFLFSGMRQQGVGSYSTVFSAHSRLTGRAVALKRIRLDGQQEGMPTTALREVSLLRQLAGSAHIVQLEDVLWDQRSLYLVMEQLSCDLREHIDCDPTARELPAVKSAMYQTLKGVAYAHAHRVIHRDLKPQNLLLDRRSGAIKVADFGLARTICPPARAYTHEVVTLLYRAPEILLGLPTYSTPVDAWSLGCILAELCSGRPPFQGDSEIGQLLSIFRALGTPSEEEWPGVSGLPDWQPCFPQWRRRDLSQLAPQLDPLGLDLLGQMLRYDPASRIRCRDALAHPWFDDIREAEDRRSAAVLELVRRMQAERALRMEEAAAAYSHLLEEAEGPPTPIELLSVGSAHALAMRGAHAE